MEYNAAKCKTVRVSEKMKSNPNKYLWYHDYVLSLTVGKIYRIVEMPEWNKNLIRIIDNVGDTFYYNKDMFELMIVGEGE